MGAITGLRSLAHTLLTILADSKVPVPDVSFCEQPYDALSPFVSFELDGGNGQIGVPSIILVTLTPTPQHE